MSLILPPPAPLNEPQRPRRSMYLITVVIKILYLSSSKWQISNHRVPTTAQVVEGALRPVALRQPGVLAVFNPVFKFLYPSILHSNYHTPFAL